MNSKHFYSLFWNNHNNSLKSAFDIFRCDNELVDVTLSCEGRKLKAHKIVLSACSQYFLDLFRDNPCQHPIIILRDIKYNILVDILNFMYLGEVNIDIDNLEIFLKTAEVLNVKGLIDDSPSHSYITKDELQNRKEKYINKMETESISEEYHSPLKKYKNETTVIEPIEEETNESMHETMEIAKTDTETDDDLDNYSDDELNTISNAPDYCDELHETFPGEVRTDSDITPVNSPTNSKDSYPCRFCDKVFSHPNNLKQHIPTHSGKTCCILCHTVLSRKYELKAHMRKKHNIDLS